MAKFKYLPKAEAYAAECRAGGTLANRAGFLRRYRIPPGQYRTFCDDNKDEAGLIDALFEDEALNSGSKSLSATVLGMYLKSLFGERDDEAPRISVISMQDGEDAL